MKAAFLVVATTLLANGWGAYASAAEIPTSYVVDEKALKKNAPAGTTVTFGLYSDETCTALVDSETENIENVALRERIKPLKVAGDTIAVKNLVELRHTFTASPAAGADLYVQATASVPAAIDTTTTLLGACQAQEPAAGSAAAAPSGAIIPFASGLPVTMTTTPSGTPDNVGIAGFGRSASVPLVGGMIDLSGGGGSEVNFAFSVPRNGTITSLTGFFSSSTAILLFGTTVTVTASLYCTSPFNNHFVAVPGSSVAVAVLAGSLPSGTISSGISSALSIPVTAATRCLAVYSTDSTGLVPNTTISGYVGGGVSIE
jgi:BclB C-terminal domain-containing protein